MTLGPKELRDLVRDRFFSGSETRFLRRIATRRVYGSLRDKEKESRFKRQREYDKQTQEYWNKQRKNGEIDLRSS